MYARPAGGAVTLPQQEPATNSYNANEHKKEEKQKKRTKENGNELARS